MSVALTDLQVEFTGLYGYATTVARNKLRGAFPDWSDSQVDDVADAAVVGAWAIYAEKRDRAMGYMVEACELGHELTEADAIRCAVRWSVYDAVADAANDPALRSTISAIALGESRLRPSSRSKPFEQEGLPVHEVEPNYRRLHRWLARLFVSAGLRKCDVAVSAMFSVADGKAQESVAREHGVKPHTVGKWLDLVARELSPCSRRSVAVRLAAIRDG